MTNEAHGLANMLAGFQALQSQQKQATNTLLRGLFPAQLFGRGVGGTPFYSWRDRWGIAERRALRLFKDMYGWKAMGRYLRHGYVDFNAKDGRTYRVSRGKGSLIEVFQRTKQGKKHLYSLCLTDTENIPLTDAVLKRLWMLRCNPNSLHEQANVRH